MFGFKCCIINWQTAIQFLKSRTARLIKRLDNQIADKVADKVAKRAIQVAEKVRGNGQRRRQICQVLNKYNIRRKFADNIDGWFAVEIVECEIA